MEDDILHFPEGVLADDVIGAGLVGIVALREDCKTVIKFAPSNIQFDYLGWPIKPHAQR